LLNSTNQPIDNKLIITPNFRISHDISAMKDEIFKKAVEAEAKLKFRIIGIPQYLNPKPIDKFLRELLVRYRNKLRKVNLFY